MVYSLLSLKVYALIIHGVRGITEFVNQLTGAIKILVILFPDTVPMPLITWNAAFTPCAMGEAPFVISPVARSVRFIPVISYRMSLMKSSQGLHECILKLEILSLQ
jgi:hypothetical protein